MLAGVHENMPPNIFRIIFHKKRLYKTTTSVVRLACQSSSIHEILLLRSFLDPSTQLAHHHRGLLDSREFSYGSRRFMTHCVADIGARPFLVRLPARWRA